MGARCWLWGEYSPLPPCACRWGGDAITAPLPAVLTPLLEAWVHKGHQLLAAPGVGTLFLDPRGRPHTRDSWGRAWKAMLQAWDCPAIFPYHRLRHIFVEDRLQHPEQVRVGLGAAGDWGPVVGWLLLGGGGELEPRATHSCPATPLPPCHAAWSKQ